MSFITLKKENTLLFFSVPYESGWHATVNGKEVDVEKVNVGFMAVEVPGDTVSKVEFTYRTPGLSTGILITVISVGVYLVYGILVMLYCRKTGKRPLGRKRKFRILRKDVSLSERARRKAEKERQYSV